MKAIATEKYLWDLRFWKKDRDPKEVREWVMRLTNKNCGHVVFCIKRLRDIYEYPIGTIIRAILDNPHTQYQDKKDRGMCIGSIIDTLGAEMKRSTHAGRREAVS